MTAAPAYARALAPSRTRWSAFVLDKLPYAASAAISGVLIARGSVVVGHQRVFTLFDDSMISMRDAENLAHGHGLVWNPGKPPVEGYTNLLWTLYMAGLHALRLPTAAIVLGVAGTGVVLVLLAARLAGSLATAVVPEVRAVRLAAVWSVALCFPVLYWSAVGTEVGLVAFCLLAATLKLHHWVESGRRVDLGLAAAALAAGVLSREDLAVLAALFVIYAWWRSPQGTRTFAVLVVGGTVVAALVAVTAFQLAVYHELVPNTYFLKVSGIPLSGRIHRGVADLAASVVAGLWVPVFAAVSYFVVVGRRAKPVASLLMLVFLLQCAYSVWVGGDTYDLVAGPGRFIAEALPALLVVAVCALGELAVRRQASGRAVMIGALAVVFVLGALCIVDFRPVVPGRFGGLAPDPVV